MDAFSQKLPDNEPIEHISLQRGSIRLLMPLDSLSMFP
jgi:hypothetical protein